MKKNLPLITFLFFIKLNLLIGQNSSEDFSKQEARVSHWIYFENQEDMNACKEKLEAKSFSGYSVLAERKSSKYYELHIYRTDDTDINAVFAVTSKLKRLAEKYNGKYEGWETSADNE